MLDNQITSAFKAYRLAESGFDLFFNPELFEDLLLSVVLLDDLLLVGKVGRRRRRQGDGEGRSEIELLIEELNLTNEVHLLGFLPELRHQLLSADIFLIPSFFSID